MQSTRALTRVVPYYNIRFRFLTRHFHFEYLPTRQIIPSFGPCTKICMNPPFLFFWINLPTIIATETKKILLFLFRHVINKIMLLFCFFFFLRREWCMYSTTGSSTVLIVSTFVYNRKWSSRVRSVQKKKKPRYTATTSNPRTRTFLYSTIQHMFTPLAQSPDLNFSFSVPMSPFSPHRSHLVL